MSIDLTRIDPDTSGGYVLFQSVSTGGVHFHRIHVDQFNPDTLAYLAGSSGSDASVNDTAASLVKGLANCSSAPWAVAGIYHVDDPSTSPRLVAVPAGAGFSAGGALSPSTVRAGELSINLRDSAGDAARIVISDPGASVFNADVKGFVSTLTGTLSPVEKLVGYLTNNINAEDAFGITGGLFGRVVSHTGDSLQLPATVTSYLNHRLRRRYRLT